MARRKNHLTQAVSLMWRTRPFLRMRLAVYSVFFFATIGYFSVTVLLLRAGGTPGPDGTVTYSAVRQIIVLAVALALYVLARRYTGQYMSYSGQAPHLFTMVSAMQGEPLPKGGAQIDWATARLEEAYPDTSRFLHLETVVGRGLRQIHKEVLHFDTTRGKKPSKLTPIFQRLATRYIRSAVVGYAFWVGKPNVYHSSRRGLARYAQAADPVARSAVRVFVLGLVIGLLLVGALLAVSWSIVSSAEQTGPVLLAVVLAGLVKAAWVLKAAFYDPIGQAWMLSVFIRHVDDQPSPEADLIKRLDEASKAFRELGERAREFDPVARAGEKLQERNAEKKAADKAAEKATDKAGSAPPRKVEALPAVATPKADEVPNPPSDLPPGASSGSSKIKIEIDLDEDPPHKA